MEGQHAQVRLVQIDGAPHQTGEILARLVDGPDAGLGVRREVLAGEPAGEVGHTLEVVQDFGAHALDQERGGVLRTAGLVSPRREQDGRRPDAEIAIALDHDEATVERLGAGVTQVRAEAPGSHAGVGDGGMGVHHVRDRALPVGL